MNHPLLLLLLLGTAAYAARQWYEDFQACRSSRPPRNPLPGTTPAPPRAILIAMGGALVLLAIETAGEIALGVAHQQSRMTWLFALYSMVAAPFIEELIFRGWLVIENRGRRVLWLGAVGASALFALIHPFLWEWDSRGFVLMLNAKGAFSTAIIFATSLWLYAARFASWNPQRSLLPCFAGHAAKNVGVVLVKAGTGYMGGWW